MSNPFSGWDQVALKAAVNDISLVLPVIFLALIRHLAIPVGWRRGIWDMGVISVSLGPVL